MRASSFSKSLDESSSDWILQVLDFCDELDANSKGVWNDEHGAYKVVIGSNVIARELSDLTGEFLAIGQEIQRFMSSSAIELFSDAPDFVISFGSSDVHDRAKQLCALYAASLVTIPAPMTNDSFGTNRINSLSAEASQRAVYPSISVLDLAVLKEFSDSVNRIAIGEFVGLYYSINDYFLSRSQSVPKRLLEAIARRYNRLLRHEETSTEFLEELGIALIMKCLIMRANHDYQIGCGIDHLFAHAIEKSTGLAHGTAVYLGSILAAGLFTDWDTTEMSLSSLVQKGLESALISETDLRKLLEAGFPTLINRSIASRPGRVTMLLGLAPSDKIMEDAVIRIEEALNRS